MTNSRKHTHTHPYSFYNSYNAGKASVFTSLKGSITVEAAIAVPLFFFAVICLIYLFEIMAVKTAVYSGLSYAGRNVMQESYPISIVIPENIEKDVIRAIGEEQLERSIVVGGSSGIDCSNSYMLPGTGIGRIVAEYEVELPVPVFLVKGITQTESIRIKAWTGYEKGLSGIYDEETVYVTETGLVYHKDYHCTYLELSIRMVRIEEIEGLRNNAGGKYYACRLCQSGKDGQIFITGDGNKYHGSLTCSGLKRTVYAIPLSEVIGKGACTRCGR